MPQIPTGAPQGSNLGTFLFITHINDFVNTSILFNFIIFSEDTTTSKIDANQLNLYNKELCKLFCSLSLITHQTYQNPNLCSPIRVKYQLFIQQ